MTQRHFSKAFTLIEVLVVVAIIALLVAILLPSLSRARLQARTVQCQTNVRSVLNAFLMYSVENRGRLPGSRGDRHADWLGGDNGQPAEMIYGPNNNKGKQPEWGTIYRRYMSQQRHAYTCPDDRRHPPEVQAGQWYYSYTANLLLSGARTEMLAGAHYPLPMLSNNPQLNRTDHRQQMAAFSGVPLIIEEHKNYYLTSVDDSAWCNWDGLAVRHLPLPNGMGWSNLGFTDGHVGRVQMANRTPAMNAAQYFEANYMCVRTTGRKWVSGRSWDRWQLPNPQGPPGAMYGFMDSAPAASTENVIH
jgi:prepilin-type N-terminal cleavage/methylation domain-containing protein